MDMEKIYLTMKRTGAGNIVLGILSICIGLASERTDLESTICLRINLYAKYRFKL